MSTADQRTLKLFLQGRNTSLFLILHQFSKKPNYLSVLINRYPPQRMEKLFDFFTGIVKLGTRQSPCYYTATPF